MKHKGRKNKTISPVELKDEHLDLFIATLRKVDGYPKVRNLQKLLAPRLNLHMINAILRYLKNSKKIEIDLDGNIIWIKEEHTNNQLSIAETANFSQEFRDYYSGKADKKENQSENI